MYLIPTRFYERAVNKREFVLVVLASVYSLDEASEF